MRYSLLLLLLALPVAAQEKTAPPKWDARGVGPLPRMGITSVDISDDGKEIIVGTIAAFGDPNVIVLDDTGKIHRTYRVGQQWIDNVAFLPGSKDALAVCTMPAGKAGDRPEAFVLSGDTVTLHKVKHEGVWFFHYGDHSNHPTLLLARAKNATAMLAGNRVVIERTGREAKEIRLPVSEPDAAVSLAVDDSGWAVVGVTSRESALGNNLYLIDPDQPKPVWSRPANNDVEAAPELEKGLYGMPTLPDGTREELAQRDEKVWAPLSVAIHFDGKKRHIAVADCQGWQRWVRSSATRKDDNQGLRFMPTRPTITVVDEMRKVVRRISAEQFVDRVTKKNREPFWCDLRFDGSRLNIWPRHWKCRGLAGQSILPVDDTVGQLDEVDIWGNNPITPSMWALNGGVLDFTLGVSGTSGAGGWSGWRPISQRFADFIPKAGGPHLVRQVKYPNYVVASANGTIECRELDKGNADIIWQIDLNKSVPKSPKPFVANARATPIVPGVWQIPGGRVESDLGGQRVIEAPDGLILIEGHAGLSFEREWAAMDAVGLDPRKVKYVLATHEHGDHAPGAYLWRVATGAQFVCSDEMAYTLQHHIPQNTGYGLHPPVPTDIRVSKDTELDLAGLKVKAIRIPGHTAGSMAWHFKKSDKTFVAFGDLIMPRGVLGYSGSVNFSATDALASLRKLRDLKVDYVLPGHGAVEGPDNYLQAGVDVGAAVGWGFIKPEKPDPRFRLTAKNVEVAGWGHQATSGAFGDIDGDGRPDVVIVAPEGDNAVVKIFLNRGGKFHDVPDREIPVAIGTPHKVRVVMNQSRVRLFVAGKTAAILTPIGIAAPGKAPSFHVTPVDIGDGNHLRHVDAMPLVARRFGGFSVVETVKDRTSLKPFVPAIDGPYVDFRVIGNDLLTAYGSLYRRENGAFDKTPVKQWPRGKDWTFLAVGDFNGDGNVDAAFLSYGMDQSTSARILYGRSKTELDLPEKEDAILPLSPLLASAAKKQTFPLVRDNPVVVDWNGDGIDDLVVAHGQSDEVLIFLGGKEGLSKDRIERIGLEYRVHFEHGVYVGDFNGDGKMDLGVFGYTNTGVGAGGPPACYVWSK